MNLSGAPLREAVREDFFIKNYNDDGADGDQLNLRKTTFTRRRRSRSWGRILGPAHPLTSTGHTPTTQNRTTPATDHHFDDLSRSLGALRAPTFRRKSIGPRPHICHGLTNGVRGEKSVMWRNFKFLYTIYVEKSKIHLHVN